MQNQSYQSPTTKKSLVRTRIVVFTPTNIFEGYTSLLPQQRLLDTLNKGYIMDQVLVGKEFLVLNEADIVLSDKSRNRLKATCRIRKGNILFIIEDKLEQREAPTVLRKMNVYPYREKRPLRVVIHVMGYSLTGYIHLVSDLVERVLESSETFIPMTNVDISPKPDLTGNIFNFVAVNKNQINFVEELS
jgi:hypothetical protein